MKNNIKKYLKKKELMPKWVAETIGCSKSTMYKYITGEREMGVLKAVRLSRILGCSVEDLFIITKQTKDNKNDKQKK
tara:strand:- start:2060 stop:2290 length:231 start_codon:yes stop_codon:yes gene_type:complete